MTKKRKPTSKRLRFEILKRDGFKCRYCGRTSLDVELHVDHVVPVAKGGDSSPENLAASCQACNGGKGAVSLGDSELDQALASASKKAHTAQVKEMLRAAREFSAVRNEYLALVSQEWELRFKPMPDEFFAGLRNAVAVHSFEDLLSAMDATVRKNQYDSLSLNNACLYFYGVLRGYRNGYPR